MEIIIEDSVLLSEIQTEFRKHFPYLRLEFFEFSQSNENMFSKKNLIIDSEIPLGKVRHMHIPGFISMNGNQLVSTFEKCLQENFGINAQVFRKSRGNWLQTTSTDNWTLSEQNKKGLEMDTVLENPVENFEEDKENR